MVEGKPLIRVPQSMASIYARMESAPGRGGKARTYPGDRGLAELQEVG